jgi:hypothetical protein
MGFIAVDLRTVLGDDILRMRNKEIEMFAYIPTNFKVQISRLDRSEYFGSAYEEGKASAALFVSEKGGPVVVWTAGSWDALIQRTGGDVIFQHTQTRAKKRMTLVSVLDRQGVSALSSFFLGNKKISEWTLK